MAQKKDRFYASDIRGADLCMSGGRMYFARKGWDWNDFLINGLPLTYLEEAGDFLALAVLKHARERAN